MAAGPNALRGPGPNRSHAFEDALRAIVLIRQFVWTAEVCPWRTLPCPVMGRPPEFLQPLAQGRNACLSGRIVCSISPGEKILDQPNNTKIFRTSTRLASISTPAIILNSSPARWFALQ